MLNILLNAIKIIFVLSFLVLIHEGGHFLVAKLFKVKVNEFSIGFGKSLFSKQKGETLYSIRMIPLGGYVSMLGEEERSDDERSFSKQSIPKRIAIVAAGGLVNIFFGLMVYFLIIAYIGNFPSKNIESVVAGYGAELAGLQPNDEIVAINGKTIFITEDVRNQMIKAGSNTSKMKIKRNGEIKEIYLNPTAVSSKTISIYLDANETTKVAYILDESPAKGILEVGDMIIEANGEEVRNNYEKLISIIENTETELKLKIERDKEIKDVSIVPIEQTEYHLGVVFKQADKDIFTRLYYSWFETGNFALSLIDNVKQLFTGKVSVNQMMGPIGISKTVVSTQTVYDFIYLIALISLSLGMTNLLPFPALDGGKIVILLIEAIRRKPLKEEVEIGIQMLGFVLLMFLAVYISYYDIIRFF